jgi:transposase-like protein
MNISTKDGLTDLQATHFFAAAESTLHRQYEALRAYFVDQLSSTEVARRFGYSPGSFRVLCHQFRHDADKRDGFFQTPRTGPQQAPTRDRVRELAVALRKQYLSVYDMQRELAQAGHAISIHSLTILVREEGFARLPRRRDDERPAVVRPEPAAVADVRVLDLEPRTFRTRLGGLFVFVPLLRDLRLHEVVRQAKLPGSAMIPAEQALRALLALKLVGKERKSHVMDLVSDEGIALFAGLNVVPKRSYLSAYSSSIDDRASARLMAAWFNETPRAGLAHGASLDLDFHTVPANSSEEPLEKHDVSRRSRSQQGILTFLARDAEQRVLSYAHAGIAKADQAAEILRFVDFWQQHTGAAPAELVFDSKLTTYAHLARLQERGIHFITLRRRTPKMLGAIYSRPASAWQRITLPALTRLFRTPKVLDQRVQLKDYPGQLRQVTVIDLGHEEPTILLTNNARISCPALVTRYAQRMLIENGIAEAVQFFHLDALSSMVGLKVDFDLQITLLASSLYRLLAEKVGAGYDHAQAKKLFRNLLDVSATVAIEPARVVVTLDKRSHNPFLVKSRLTDTPTPMPWFGDKPLHLQFA